MMLKKLINSQIIDFNKILFQNYVDLGLNEAEFVMLLHLFSLYEKKKTVLSFNGLKSKMTLSSNELSNTLTSLINKGFLDINSEISKTGKEQECFDLTPTFTLIEKLFYDEQEELENRVKMEDSSKIVSMFEREWGRSLSPLELNVVSNLSKEYSFDEIYSAALESVKASKINLKYIEAILRNNKGESKEINPDKAKAIDDFFSKIAR